MANEALSVTLQARFAQFEKQLDRVANQTDAKLRQVERRVAQTNRSLAKGLNFNPSVRGAMGLAGALGSAAGAAAALVAALGVGKVLALADEYTRYTNQLKLAGLEGAALGRTEAALLGIAQENGTELAGLGTLYGRLAQSKKELGATDAQLIQFTDGVSAALRIQGGDAQSASGALLQLSQAVGGAVVRAEEFNSINEGARPILEAVANGSDRFGGSVTKLREEVLKGTVTSKEFFDAFLKGTPALKEKAAGAALTLSQSMATLKNALMATVGEAVATTGASEDMSEAIKRLADNTDLLIPVIRGLITVTAGAIKGFADLVQGTRDVASEMKRALPPTNEMLDALSAVAGLGQITVAIRFLGLDQENAKLRESLMLLQNINPGGYVANQLRGMAARGGARRRTAAAVEAGKVTVEDMKALLAAPPAAGAPPAPPSGRNGSGGGGSGPSAADLAAREADRQQRVQDQILGELQEQLAQHAGFNRTLEETHAFAQERLAREQEQEIVLLDRQKAEKEITAEEYARLKAIIESRQAAETQNLRDRQAIEIAEGRREAEQMHLDAEMELLRLASSNAETSKERRAIELRILDLAYQEERQRLERIAADQTLTEAQREAARVTLAGLDARKAAAVEGVKLDTASPIEQFQRDTKITTDSLEEMAVRGMRSLNEALLEAITNSENAGDAIRNVFLNLLRDLALQAFNQAGANVLASVFKLPGFANGTDFAPGGLAMVGERGKELVNLPRGSQVIPNDILRKLPGAMRGGASGSQPITVHQTVNLQANGDKNIVSLVTRTSRMAVAEAVKLAGRQQPGIARSHRLLEA